MNPATNGSARKIVHCAVYTRKSTEEGQRQFTSLDAQREAAEAYIASQAHDGWLCLPDRYDDGGFTGGNMDRPALARLLTEIRAGKVDCVVVYKVDRLSRSLLDFAKLMETFDKHQISFVSVTQQFNTATSMGRLVLNILLSFAQFEREIISERTRDKIAATRRKGKWTGGVPLLGYELDPRSAQLKINPKEATRVRAIFELYLQHRSLGTTVRELARRRWRSKRRHSRQGECWGGRPFTRGSLHRLLTNVTYTGQVRYQNHLYPGEQPGIVPSETWRQVQELLQSNRGQIENRSGALLQGLLYCRSCGYAMTPTSCRPNGKGYRYYHCCGAHRRGRHTCPAHRGRGAGAAPASSSGRRRRLPDTCHPTPPGPALDRPG
jgi:site-specific DNA recombinase